MVSRSDSQGMTTSYLVQLDPEVQRPGVRALARILGWGRVRKGRVSSGAEGGPTSLLHMAGLSQGQPGSQQGTCAWSLRTGNSEARKPPRLDLHTYPDQEKLLPRDVMMIVEDINAAQPACRVPRSLSTGAAVLTLREEWGAGSRLLEPNHASPVHSAVTHQASLGECPVQAQDWDVC